LLCENKKDVELFSGDICTKWYTAVKEGDEHCNICNCDIQALHWDGHMITKKHLMNAFSEYEDLLNGVPPHREYRQCCVCSSHMHTSCFYKLELNICQSCAIEKHSRKLCILCDCYIMPSGWSQHCKTKKHRLNISRASHNW
jgi:hypothetical protein